jgi:hypothetical protein
MVLPALDHVQVLGLRHVEWTQNQRIQNTEDDRVRPDSQRQCQYGDSGETGILAHRAETKTYVLQEGFDELAADRLTTLLLEPLIATKLDARAALGFCAGKTGTLEIIGTVLDMRT